MSRDEDIGGGQRNSRSNGDYKCLQSRHVTLAILRCRNTLKDAVDHDSKETIS